MSHAARQSPLLQAQRLSCPRSHGVRRPYAPPPTGTAHRLWRERQPALALREGRVREPQEQVAVASAGRAPASEHEPA